MTAAIYARKSNAQTDVADEAKSVTRQVEGARAFITRKGWTIDEHHIYTDDGVSGALFANRVEFQRMMRDASSGAFEAVVFYDLSRFGRNTRHTMNALWTLGDLGITIWDFSTGREVDPDSVEGGMMTFMRASFGQQERDEIRKRTTDAMRQKAAAGYVTGGKVFGYDNFRVTKGHAELRVNESEAAIVRDIYNRFASGDGARSIAGALNRAGVRSPRAQQGRPNGWSASTVRAVLERPLYRGQIVYGRKAKAYGRELGKLSAREKGMIPKPEESWMRLDRPALRIIDPDVIARVDARRLDRKTRYQASVAKGGRVPERAHGKYLLSGGLLICPTCGGHFEARIAPWKGISNVYICSTRRRKPGMCSNTLALPIAETDDDVLSVVEGKVLGTQFIEDLLMLVDRGEANDTARLTAECERLRTEVDRLVGSIAAGVPAETIAPAVKERQTALTKIESQLRTPKPAPPNLDKLRAALTQRAEQWKADLRAEPTVARLVLRRLVGPLTLWDASDAGPDWAEWEASVTADLLDGLVQLGTSPTGTDRHWKVRGNSRQPA